MYVPRIDNAGKKEVRHAVALFLYGLASSFAVPAGMKEESGQVAN